MVWRISCSFGLGFVERSHQPLNCWGYESKTQLVENKNGIIIIIRFYIELVNLGLNSYEFLDFHLGFYGMNFQITNSSVVELF